MEIEFQNTKEDYKNFYKLFYKDKFQRRLAANIILPLFIGYAISGHHLDWTYFIIGAILSYLILIVAFYLIPYLVSVSKMGKSITKEESALEKKKMFITDDGLQFDSASKHTNWKWESILSVHSNRLFIYIVVADKRFILIPKRHFSSDNETVNFLGIIQTALIKVRGTAAIPKTSKKPPYLLGILCLIPMIGAIVGIGLLLYGIFYYKDKWLIIIGALGLIITVGIFSLMSYDVKHNPDIDKSFIQTSQMQLNDLMKDVEFYKMQNGVYPDRLEQISTENARVSIDDFLQVRKERKNTKYNYQKVGDNYYLFSSGIDGIPNTTDDLYPTIEKSDSCKFGLIKK